MAPDPSNLAMLDRTLRRRWLVWGAAMTVFIVGYFHRIAPGAIALDLMAAFHTTGAVLGLLSAIYFYVYSAMQIPSGILSDTLGPRWTITAGALVMGGGSVLFGLSGGLAVCCLGRFFVGLGVSVFMVNIMRVCVEWYRADEMAVMNGWTTALGGLGGLLATAPLAALSAAIGWRTGFVAIGISSIFLGILCWRVVRDKPIDCGLPSPQSGGAPGYPAGPQVFRDGPRPDILKGIIAVLANRRTWPPFIGFMAFYSTLMAFSGLWGIPYLTQVYAMPTQEAARYVMVVSVGLVAGCPVMGFVSDRLLKRRRLPYVAYACLYAAAWAVICFAGGGRPSLSVMYPLCFALGFFSAGFILSIVVAKEVNPLGLSGIAMGNNNTSGFLGSAVLQVVMGKVLDMNWDGTILAGARVYPQHAYRTAFLVCFGLSLLGLAASLLLTETGCRDMGAYKRIAKSAVNPYVL